MIVGGWPFVVWAYGLAYGGLAVYGLSLWARIDNERQGPQGPQNPGDER